MHIYILPQCSTTAAKVLKTAGTAAQSQRSQCAISRGILKHQGLIEIIGIDDRVCILCNEEGKLIGLDGNRRVGNDIIAGVFYVVGEDGWGNLVSLPDGEMEKYRKQFWEPELFTDEAVADAIVMYLLEGWPYE